MVAPIVNNPTNLAGVDISQAAIHANLFNVVPLKTTKAAPTEPVEKNAAKKGRADKVAKSKLKDKNRKRHKKSITKPYDPALESGTVYNVTGSRSDVDGPWLIVNMTHTFSKAGSTSAIEMERCLTKY